MRLGFVALALGVCVGCDIPARILLDAAFSERPRPSMPEPRVGERYEYAGRVYTMAPSNIDYHRRAIADVIARCGDPDRETDRTRLGWACSLLRTYAAHTPDPGSFTSAAELLEADTFHACARWRESAP